MTELTDLIAALEKATGPDRELSNEVLFACGWRMEEFGAGDNPSIYWIAPDGEEMLDGDHPHPTESIDAAMTLVPRNHRWNMASDEVRLDGEEIRPQAVVMPFGRYGRVGDYTSAANPAIALCIAALKARFSHQDHSS